MTSTAVAPSEREPASSEAGDATPAKAQGFNWSLCGPFMLAHVACLAVFIVGISWVAVGVAVALYFIRVLAITAFYHRGFTHKAFRMPRSVQFTGAVIANSAAQRGPLWWVATHREHHQRSDQPGDPHSPVQQSFYEAHMGWQFRPENSPTRIEHVPDLAAFPELRFLDRQHYIAPVSLAVLCFLAGWGLGHIGVNTDGPQLLVWGFFISTIALYHATFSVNSFAHRFGKRHFNTRDQSRNNLPVAILTVGEGWHNNHHRYPQASRHGFLKWQFDPTHRLLRIMAKLHMASDLRPVPDRLRTPEIAR